MNFNSISVHSICVLCCFLVTQQSGFAQEDYRKSVVKEGIKVVFSLLNHSPDTPEGEFRAGDVVKFQFKVSDTITGKPLSGAFPAAWMDKVKTDPPTDCGRKIVSYIQGDFFSRAELDLNVYYVLTLNEDNTINVVDPLFSFGGSQLLAQIQLPGTGYDWVVKEDQTTVFISMPESNKVGFIDTSNMKNEHNVTIPGLPKDIVLQPDEHYLWVAYDLPGNFESSSGVAVINTEDRTLEKTIITGSGTHQIITELNNKYVYVSNQNSGTISVIDVQTLEKVEDIPVRDAPVAMAFSKMANALYVLNKMSAVITVIDGKSHQVIGEINSEAGSNKISFTPDGRLGFILNPKTDRVHILDAATNRIVQTADVDEKPDEVSFSDELAYIRHIGSEIVWMIPLDVIGEEGKPVPLIDFSGGQNPPSLGAAPTGAPGIVQAPGANAVLVSNYLDNSIYYYAEGMAAPSGQFSTYGKRPKAVVAIDKSIEETQTGVYETTARLRSSGNYEVSLFMDVPSFMTCFPVTVLPNAELELESLRNTLGPLSINYLTTQNRPKVGEEVAVAFQLKDLKTHEVVTELRDVRVMSMNSAGNGHSALRVIETETKGVYQTKLKFNKEGLYYIYVECLSRGLTFNNPQFLTLYASKQ